MNLRTFGQLKAQIARVCGVTGMPVTDSRVMDITNLAVEELLNEGDFPWTVDRLIFRVYNGRIVLPTAYDRIIGMSVEGVPQQINSPWYEVTPGMFGGGGYFDNENGGVSGPGGFNGWWNSGFTADRDEVFQFRDIPRDQYYFLEVSTQFDEDVGDEPPRILFKGYDAVRSPVTTPGAGNDWIEGEYIDLTTSPVRSTSSFSQLSGIVKPVTRGEVYVYAVGATDGARIHVGTYAPKDESPFYRSYRVVGTPFCRSSCVLARCRKRYSPVTTDNDVVLCGNIPALKKMVQAVWYGDAGNPEKYVSYRAIAVDILKKEAMAYRGKSRIPAISFQRGYSLGGIPSVR
jgi:hypothetical protein